MSTNYYLVNKREYKIKSKLDKLIEKELCDIRKVLISLSEEEDLDIEENINYKMRQVSVCLENQLFEVEEIHICNTGYKFIKWFKCEYFTDELSFINFYNINRETYSIRDEYGTKFNLNEFLQLVKKITQC